MGFHNRKAPLPMFMNDRFTSRFPHCRNEGKTQSGLILIIAVPDHLKAACKTDVRSTMTMLKADHRPNGLMKKIQRVQPSSPHSFRIHVIPIAATLVPVGTPRRLIAFFFTGFSKMKQKMIEEGL